MTVYDAHKMQEKRIGELNGPWAAWFKIQIALVPLLFMSMIGGGIYQIAHNAKVDGFMDRKETYTSRQALEDHVVLRNEFFLRQEAFEKVIDTLRIAMQQATPEADRRLKSIEQTLAAIQADIISMRISLAQMRIATTNPTKDQKSEILHP